MIKLRTDYKEGEEFKPSAEQLNTIGVEINSIQNIDLPDEYWTKTKMVKDIKEIVDGKEVIVSREIITAIPNVVFWKKMLTEIVKDLIGTTPTNATLKLGK